MIINNVDTDLSDNTYWTNIDYKFIDCLSEKETKDPVISFSTISGIEIENQIANIRHILFEVTDSCNMSCAYCGYGEF